MCGVVRILRLSQFNCKTILGRFLRFSKFFATGIGVHPADTPVGAAAMLAQVATQKVVAAILVPVAGLGKRPLSCYNVCAPCQGQCLNFAGSTVMTDRLFRWCDTVRVCCLVTLLATGLIAEEERFRTRDTLAEPVAATDDARACLQGLCWKPAEFELTVEAVTDADHQAVIRFPSALDTGDEVNDRVALLWHRPAKNDPAKPGPAMIVVHESGSAMPVGKLFARRFAEKGMHAFLIHLPNYGLRRRDGTKPTGEKFLLAMRQAIADVRRARDAIAVLPGIDPQRISLQGTSLGGFVAATTSGLDQSFDHVFIMLAGGDIYGLMQTGKREAAELSRRLETAGYSGDKLRDLLWTIEPTRLAGRVNPQKTWLYSAEQDAVVPMANALAFKQSAGLDHEHHIRLPGDHISTIVFLPVIIDHVIKQVGLPPSTP